MRVADNASTVWDADENQLIQRARLLNSSPEVVYEELMAYGRFLSSGHTLFSRYDKELEAALAERNDPLINLGLAYNGVNHEVLGKFYANAKSGDGDAAYNKALQVAVLSNKPAADMQFSFAMLPAISEDEFRRIAKEGDEDELSALLRNPGARGVLTDIFNRKPPLDALPDERWRQLVMYATSNPGLNYDDSNEHGPDLTAWDVQKGVLNVLMTATADSRWVRSLHSLLMALNPSNVSRLPSKGEAIKLIERWRNVKVPKMFGSDKGEDAEGYYTDSSMSNEFTCLLAALFGRVFVSNKFENIGSPDDAELVMRCACVRAD